MKARYLHQQNHKGQWIVANVDGIIKATATTEDEARATAAQLNKEHAINSTRTLVQSALSGIQFLDELGGADDAQIYMRVMRDISNECDMRAARCFESHIKGAIYTDTRYKDGRFYVDELTDGRVRFHGEGGGFSHSVTLAEFLEHFQPAPALTFKAARVTGEWLTAECTGADKDVVFPCYMDGRRWNGWAMPYFQHATAADMLTASGNTWSFDKERDAFIIAPPDINADEDPEVYEGVDIETPDGRIHVYPVGAGAWTWDNVEDGK